MCNVSWRPFWRRVGAWVAVHRVRRTVPPRTVLSVATSAPRHLCNVSTLCEPISSENISKWWVLNAFISLLAFPVARRPSESPSSVPIRFSVRSLCAADRSDVVAARRTVSGAPRTHLSTASVLPGARDALLSRTTAAFGVFQHGFLDVSGHSGTIFRELRSYQGP